MGSSSELNSFLNRTRKKKIVGRGNDNSAKMNGEPVGGATANWNIGSAIAGIRNINKTKKAEAKAKQDENNRNYMRKKFAEREEVRRDPNRIKEAKQRNEEVKSAIKTEVRLSKAGNHVPDRGSISDWMQDYVALDDEMGKASRQDKNKGVARKYLKGRK